MSDPLRDLLGSGAVPSTSLPPTSRYRDVGVTVWLPVADDSAEPAPVPHLRRRLVPAPERHALLHEHTVEGGDRADLIAARQLGDPALWWRLADANGVIDPARLTDPVGRRLRITTEADIPGASDAD